MISATLLLAYAVSAGTIGAASLRGAAWALKAPRVAILLWQCLAISLMLALTGAGAALAVSLAPIGSGLAEMLHLCANNFRRGYASPGGALAALAGLTLIVLLVGRLVWHGVNVWMVGSHERRDCRRSVRLLGRADVRRGAVILEHQVPYAFCVGGRRSQVVLTTGLTELLSEAEIRAVLAHEAAHLTQRHHLCLDLCQTLFLTLRRPFAVFGQALPQIRVLLELSADDYARRREGDEPLHAALSKLARLSVPSGGLAASSEGVDQRLRRIEARPRPLGPIGLSATLATAAFSILVPMALAAAPAVQMAKVGLCLIG